MKRRSRFDSEPVSGWQVVGYLLIIFLGFPAAGFVFAVVQRFLGL
jgi:hypothetical protein